MGSCFLIKDQTTSKQEGDSEQFKNRVHPGTVSSLVINAVNAEAGIREDCERYEQPAEQNLYTCTPYCDVHCNVKHEYIDLSSERNYKSKIKNT